jgi:UDP-N-acetylglucosamine 1-carboxyvinyltransferase
MDRIRIGGGRKLKGDITISGAKNAALPLIAASLLTEAPLTLTNVPNLADVVYMVEILRQLGVGVAWRMAYDEGQGGTIKLTAPHRPQSLAPYDTVRKMRASFLVLGPLVARVREATVSLPGGCAIGTRPVDLHLKGLAAMGAEIELAGGYVLARAPRGLQGAVIDFPSVSVGATEHLMMAASLAKGTTVLNNAAREPEIGDLGRCLIAMGAHISGLDTSTITIEGVSELGPATHYVLPDRIEIGTFAIAVTITGGEVELIGAQSELIGALVPLLRRCGAEVEPTNMGLKVSRNGVAPVSADVATAPFPGFPTDLQAQFMALMTVAHGTSHIKETIFENRFMHVPELARMGADIQIDGEIATVRGVRRLIGAPVMATDLRASSSLVLAGLAAEGDTIVNRVYHLDRGFERLEEKLARCGADIERLKQ